MRRVSCGALTALAVVLGPFAASAATFTLFTEDFAEEAALFGVAQTNFFGLDQFAVADGTVDIFENGGFGLPCPSTACLDLDGSTSNAGRIVSGPLSFLAGVSYTLSFNISGNARGGASDTVSVGIDNGVLGATDYLRAPFDPYGIVTASFTVAADTTGRLFFDHAGGDNFGILLDRVEITGDGSTGVVPLPPAAALLVTALGALGLRGARRSARRA